MGAFPRPAWSTTALLVLLALVVIAYGRFLVRVDHGYGDDDLEYVVPYSQYIWNSHAHDESPLWNPNSDLGTPLWSTGPYVGPYYPLFPLYAVLKPGSATNAGYLVHLLWAALGMFLLLRRRSAAPAAAVGALALVLSGHFLMHANEGYLPSLVSASHLPWVVLGLDSALDGRWRHALLAGLPLGLALLGGHVVTTAVVMFAALAFAVGRGLTVPEHRMKHAGAGLLAFGVALAGAIGLSAIHWFPALGDFLGSAGERPFETSTLVWSQPWRVLTYALPLTDPGSKGAEYVGAIPLLLVAAGLRLRRDPTLLAGLLVALGGCLAIVSPVIGLLDPVIALAPPLRAFSHVWLFGVAVSFGLALAAGRGAALLLEAAAQAPHKLEGAARVAMATTFAVLVAGALIRALGPEGPRHAGALRGALASLPWVACGGLLVVGLLISVRRGLVRGRRLGPALMALVAVELLALAWIGGEPAGQPFDLARYYRGGEIVEAIDRDGRRGRVLHYQVRTHERDWVLRRNESMIRGYASANLEAKVLPPGTKMLSDRLQGLSLVRDEIATAAKGGSDPRGLKQASLHIGPGADDVNRRLLDLAGVGYLVVDRQRPVLGNRFDRALASGSARLWINPDVWPTARMVGRGRVVPDSQVWDELLAPRHDPARQVLLAPSTSVATSLAIAGRSGRSGAVTMLHDRPTERGFSVDTTDGAFLVLSQAWHPGWTAAVDGRAAPVLRADGCFTAVPVPAGAHQVLLSFEPPAWLAGVTFSVLTLLALIALAIFDVRKRRRGVS